MPSRQQLVELMTLGGGLNLTSDPLHVRDTETPDCLNVDFDQRGAVKKRMGYVQRGTTDTNGAYDSIIPYKKADGTSTLILTRQGFGTRQMNTSYTITDITSSTQSASGINEGLVAGDSVYIVNNVDGTLKWDGTTATRFGTTLGTANNHPKAAHIAYHKNRLFLGNTGQGANRSRVYFTGSDSTPTDLTFVKTTSFIDFDPDDGDEIIALVPFLDQLTVFKKNKVFTLRGNDPRSFTKVLNNPSLGCIASRTAAAWDKGVIFLSDRGVFSFDGTKVIRVSEKIDPALNALPGDILSKAVGTIFELRYYLFVNSSATNPFNDTVFVFDFVTQTWTKYFAWESHDTVIWHRLTKEELFGVDARTRNKIFQFRVGTTDAPLSTPAAPALASFDTGGSLSDGTYRYKVTALNSAGETVASATATTGLLGGTATQRIEVTPAVVPGATSYNVYGRTTGSQLLIGNTTSVFNDTGSVTPSGASPSVNTTDRISAYFTTKWLDFGVPERRKMGRSLYTFFDAELGGIVNVDISKNYQAAQTIPKTVDLDPEGMVWGTSTWGSPTLWGGGRDVVRERLRGLGTATAFRIKVHDLSTIQWTLLGFSFVLQPRNLA